MLLELSVGDSYGFQFEYASKEFVEKYNDLSGYVQHPTHDIVPGNYSDDTQMSIAITRLILSNKDWTLVNIADFFVNTFKRDPIIGYSSKFQSFLEKVETGQELLENIIPDSDKSGAAMRAIPIGIYHSENEVVEKSVLQGQITHNTPDGLSAACASALLSHYFIYDKGNKKNAGEYITSFVDGDWTQEWHGKVGSKGWMSVLAAITAIRNHDNMADILKKCVSYTGDVDTVATIALGAASSCKEIKQNLPNSLIDNLTNATYGKDYIVALDRLLMKRKK